MEETAQAVYRADYGLDERGFGVRFLAKIRDLSLLLKVGALEGSGAQPPPIKEVREGNFFRDKAAGSSS
jgi:hypothetical protein